MHIAPTRDTPNRGPVIGLGGGRSPVTRRIGERGSSWSGRARLQSAHRASRADADDQTRVNSMHPTYQPAATMGKIGTADKPELESKLFVLRPDIKFSLQEETIAQHSVDC